MDLALLFQLVLGVTLLYESGRHRTTYDNEEHICGFFEIRQVIPLRLHGKSIPAFRPQVKKKHGP